MCELIPCAATAHGNGAEGAISVLVIGGGLIGSHIAWILLVAGPRPVVAEVGT